MQTDYEPAMRRLIKTIIRTFYEPHHVVIADILLENILLSDTEFCARMKMLSREFNKLIIRLKDDRLIKSDIKVEVKEDNKQMLRTVYFFNYAEVRDIIKYKIFKMTKNIEIKLSANEESFYCENCERSFSALDVQASMEDFVFKCMFCRSELVERNISQSDKGIDLKDLMGSLEHIIKLLKEADSFKIPTLDYFQILEIKKEKEASQRDHAQDATPQNTSNTATRKEELYEKAEEYFGFDNTKLDSAGEHSSNNSSKIDECVYVAGVKKPFSEITEEDKEIMTEDEYIRYFEVYSKYSK